METLLPILGTAIGVPIITAAGLTIYRLSRRYYWDGSGRMRISFLQAGPELKSAVARTRLNEARNAVLEISQNMPVDPSVVSNCLNHKIVDPDPHTQVIEVSDGDNLIEDRLQYVQTNPTHLDITEIPQGMQLLKVSPYLVSTAVSHSAYKERTTALLQAVYRKVMRETTNIRGGVTLGDKVQLAIASTMVGFIPTVEELAALQHMHSDPIRQRTNYVNLALSPNPPTDVLFRESDEYNAFWFFGSSRIINSVEDLVGAGRFRRMWIKFNQWWEWAWFDRGGLDSRPLLPR